MPSALQYLVSSIAQPNHDAAQQLSQLLNTPLPVALGTRLVGATEPAIASAATSSYTHNAANHAMRPGRRSLAHVPQ